MKITNAFPSKYLAAADIPEEGLIVQIKSVTFETVGQGADADDKFVIQFTDSKIKPMVCNKTNANTIHKITGSDDSDDWEGARLRLIALEVQGPNGMAMAIRISPKAPQPVAKSAPRQPVAAPAEEVHEDDVPF